jgi:uncharacterized protein YjbJ (UPF0337 family)
MNSNMEHNHDKIAGFIHRSVGGFKEEVGRSNGDAEMTAEGAVQKAKGNTQPFSAAVQNLVKKGKNLLGIKSENS